MMAVRDAASFWIGAGWAATTIGVARFLLELHRCSKGWRRQ